MPWLFLFHSCYVSVVSSAIGFERMEFSVKATRIKVQRLQNIFMDERRCAALLRGGDLIKKGA
jgi:hypothetical protein